MAWQQAIIWTNDGLVYWRIYASLGLKELKSHTFFLSSITGCFDFDLFTFCWLPDDVIQNGQWDLEEYSRNSNINLGSTTDSINHLWMKSAKGSIKSHRFDQVDLNWMQFTGGIQLYCPTIELNNHNRATWANQLKTPIFDFLFFRWKSPLHCSHLVDWILI